MWPPYGSSSLMAGCSPTVQSGHVGRLLWSTSAPLMAGLEELSLPGCEYRMCEKLYRITAKIALGKELLVAEQLKWRTRYAADMRNRRLLGRKDMCPFLLCIAFGFGSRTSSPTRKSHT